MRRFLLSMTALFVGPLLAASTTGSAGAASVSPTTFTTRVCAAIATATDASTTTLAAFKDAVAAYKASPSPTTAAAVRDAYTQAYQNLDHEMTSVLAAVDQAGTPSSGAAFVDALKRALQAQQNAAQRFAQQSAAIDTSSASTFASAFQQTLDAAKAEGAKMRRAMKADSAIKSAPNKYHRLVVVMTTDADTCPKR